MFPDVPRPSLTDVFRSLNVAPDYHAALVELAGKVERLEAQLEFQEMQARCERPQPPGPPRQPRFIRGAHARPQRHLRVVKVLPFAVAGMWAALRAAAAWAGSRGARRAVGAAAGVALAGGTVVAVPHMAAGPVRGAPDVVHAQPVPRLVHHPRPGTLLPVGLAPVMAHRRRRAERRDHRADRRQPPSPSPSPPSPSPTPSVLPSPSPSPSPVVTVTPVPGQVTAQAPWGPARVAWSPMLGAIRWSL